MTFRSQPYNLLIIGGGINGAGIATDAAGREIKTILCEQGDLASATSSASSKLIHCGLRYLEQDEFRLVRESLAEREALLKKAPHIIKPLRFCLPYEPHLRPAWMLRAGLFLYDNLSKRITLPASQGISFNSNNPLVDDARLVILNTMDARNRGATILPRTKCIEAARECGLWHAKLQDQSNKEIINISCRALVNAAGPG